MHTSPSFKRLTLRGVLRNVSPMVIRVLAVPDSLTLAQFDEIFCTMLGWDGLGYSVHIHGQEFTSFLRKSMVHRKTLGDFHLRARDTFRYTCGGLDLWDWEVRVLASEVGTTGDEAPLCLAGRGASPPECCGGPTGYRLMLKRQQGGESMGTPARVETVIAMLTAAHPDRPSRSWEILREVMDDGMRSIDQRLEHDGPLEPHRFSVEEANQRWPNWSSAGGGHMKFRVDVICVNKSGVETRCEIMELARGEVAMETLGLSLAEGKALLAGCPRRRDLLPNQRGSGTSSRLSDLWSAVPQQRGWNELRRDRVRACEGA